MNIKLIVKISIEVLITWATVFIATYRDGMTHAQFFFMIAAMIVQGGRDVLKEMANPNSADPFPAMKKAAVLAASVRTGLAVLMLCFLMGCAHTSFAAMDGSGKGCCIAHFEGDMTGQSFHYFDGRTTVAWYCQSVSHSAATTAQGAAAHQVIGGVATGISATGAAVAVSGMLPGGLGGLFNSLLHHP